MIVRNWLFGALILICFSAVEARADEETRNLVGGIAAGIVGLALEHVAAQENQSTQKEEIQWDNAPALSSQSTLKYDDRVAEIQLRLKRINQYYGKIDGLKGHETTDAIETWEHFNSNAVDGEISDEEMKMLVAMTESSQDAPADSKTDVAEKAEENPDKKEMTDISENEKNLAKEFYNFEGNTSAYQACMKFKESGNPYAIYLDRTFQTNFQNFEQLTSQFMKLRADCLGISEDKFNEIKNTAQEKYKKSDDAKMYQLGTAMVIAGQEDPQNFVNGCNTISQSFSLMYEKFKDQEFDQKTCDAAK